MNFNLFLLVNYIFHKNKKYLVIVVKFTKHRTFKSKVNSIKLKIIKNYKSQNHGTV